MVPNSHLLSLCTNHVTSRTNWHLMQAFAASSRIRRATVQYRSANCHITFTRGSFHHNNVTAISGQDAAPAARRNVRERESALHRRC